MLSGQAEKEFYVNEAHALADAIIHCAIEDVTDTPPTAPGDGQCWLVGPAPTGAWTGHAETIACRQLGNWLFVEPRDGIALLNRTTGQTLRFNGGWIAPTAPSLPSGGTTVDSEGRAALAALIAALAGAGIFVAP